MALKSSSRVMIANTKAGCHDGHGLWLCHISASQITVPNFASQSYVPPNNHFPKSQQMTHPPKSYVGSTDNTSVEAARPPDSFLSSLEVSGSSLPALYWARPMI